MENSRRIKLLGLDFGSTTSSALVASAYLHGGRGSGRQELSDFRIEYRSEPVFTPMSESRLDEGAIARLVDQWLSEARFDPSLLHSAGAIVTGLAALKENSRALSEILRSRVGEAVLAVADDPRLESWYAFMGSAHRLSVRNPTLSFLNLDIGGGTTNVALGRRGDVRVTGSYFIGARHVCFRPGSYEITGLTSQGAAALEGARLKKRVGDVLSESEVASLVALLVRGLEAIVSGRKEPLLNTLHHAEFSSTFEGASAITFSGGVGELVYHAHRTGELPTTTLFGDLGIDLARRILSSPLLSRDLDRFVPETLGRATVYGVAMHHAELSGVTLFLPDAGRLPLRDLPIIGRITAESTPSEIEECLRRVKEARGGGCLRISDVPPVVAEVRRVGECLRDALQSIGYPAMTPLVLFVDENFGKTLGNYVTDWGSRAFSVIVIDEIDPERASFASLGKLREGSVPVSFYGFQ